MKVHSVDTKLGQRFLRRQEEMVESERVWPEWVIEADVDIDEIIDGYGLEIRDLKQNGKRVGYVVNLAKLLDGSEYQKIACIAGWWRNVADARSAYMDWLEPRLSQQQTA